MRHFIGLIHKEAGSDYDVSFPDFPGCVTTGTSLDDARAMAAEALVLHIAGMIKGGEAVPEPSTLDQVMENRENRDAVAILVPSGNVMPKTIRVNLSLPEDVLAEIDQYATAHGLTRSGFLVRAAKKAIETQAA